MKTAYTLEGGRIIPVEVADDWQPREMEGKCSTWEDARQVLLRTLNRKLTLLKNEMHKTRSKYGQVAGMQDPTMMQVSRPRITSELARERAVGGKNDEPFDSVEFLKGLR